MSCSNCKRWLNAQPGQRYVQCRHCGTLNSLTDRFSFDAMRRALPHPAGPKRAVICAVSYKGQQDRLRGCINDARSMRRVLVDVLGFPRSSILMLNEEEPQRLRPTVENIKKALRWLVRGSQSGDSLLFHFSGHGRQSRRRNTDELDGRDELICALDGDIVDDELNDLIVKPIPQGVKLHAVMDCCSSGTVLDLPFLCEIGRGNNRRYRWIDHRPKSGAWKGTSGGKVYCFSGCKDNQSAQESSRLVQGKTLGVMTFRFIEAVALLVSEPSKSKGITYGKIMDSIHFNIREDERRAARKSLVKRLKLSEHRNKDINSISDLLDFGMIITDRPANQEPQLTANKCFDVYEKRFSI